VNAPQPVLAVGGILLELHPAVEGANVLLVKRGRPPQQSRWSLPGGRVEAGERLAAAVARELLEETGITVEVGVLVEAVEIIEPSYHYVILDYLCARAEGSRVVPVAGDDAAEASFVPVSELFARGCSDRVIEVVARAIELQRASLSAP
jgi:8-oxo-dGTP diphosphatase